MTGARLIDEAWREVVGDDAARRVPIDVTGGPGHLPSRLAVEDVAIASISVAMLSASALAEARGVSVGRPSVDRAHAAAAVRSERHFQRGGASAGSRFAPLSRFWSTADGWVRTHANYPWHRAALLSALGTTDDAETVAAAMAERKAEDVEAMVFAAGGVAAAVRTGEEWRTHPQGAVVGAEPLISHRLAGDADARRRGVGDLPASGVRVLDLTRVIAGPVCTRYLAALGADVLRIDPPGHPDMPAGELADTLLGKRSAFLDLTRRAGASQLNDLLDGADVVVCGYRPGALDRFGLGAGELAARHPGLVAVYLSAWGHTGPWRGRRGFDSIVQAPTGIAMAESADETPGVLPCQLLDHGTGYLAAAAALDGLRRQALGGGTHIRRVSLARTAAWLMSRSPEPPRRPAAGAATPRDDELSRWLVEIDAATANGPASVTAVLPPGRFGDRPLQWLTQLSGYGVAPPAWRSSS